MDSSKGRTVIIGPGEDAAAIARAMAMLEESGMKVINIEDIEKEGIVIGEMPVMEIKPRPEIDFDLAMIDMKYSHLSKKEREAHIEPVRTEPKIGRNEPCPCGSGKKYKKCCNG